jgi:N-dimethylarginine dimethylaminohydrolase
VIEDEGLVARSAALGAHLLARLRAIDSPLVADVRGRGLWAGVELDPRRASARRVVARLAERGVLSKETHETVIRIAPPLVISRQALDWGLDVLIATLREFDRAPQRAGGNTNRSAGIVTRRRKDVQEQHGQAATGPRAHLAMCAPDHFEVSYRINPWMDPAQWAASAERLAQDARHGWLQLKSTYERLGARVDVQPPQPGLPDMVFTANAALVLDRKALLARFRCAERQGEEPHDRAFLQALRARGAIDEIVEVPAGLIFEGAGDAIWDATRGVLWTGYGQRSSYEMQYVLAETFAVPTVALELVDPRFYHLDTCFCVLSGGEVIAYRPAFGDRSFGLIEELVGRDKLIRASDEDAQRLAVNSVCLGRDVVLCHASAALRGALLERGYRPHVVALDAFNHAGGAAYCLTLRLDLQTRPAAGHATSFVEDDFAEFRAAA